MIPFQRPALPPTAAIDRYLERSREARRFSNGGPCLRLLAERLGDRAGAFCTPVASGTLGLMAALAAVLGDDRRAGTAVMPSFTFVATAQAAIWSGLRPRLHDIDPSHWHLASDALEGALRRGGVGAVLAVSAFGTPPPPHLRERWERACATAVVPLVIDSAAGFGAVAADGVPIGAQGDVEIVSFHATKPFAVGEGGAVFTRDRGLHERIGLAVNFGFRPDRTVAHGHGLNAKMSELHAATALAVLDGIDDVLVRRREAAAAIRAGAGAAVAWQAGSELSTWQFVPVALADRGHRDAVLAACGERIETRLYYEPLDRLLPAGSADPGDELGATAELCERILCLPMANDLGADALGAITAALRVG